MASLDVIRNLTIRATTEGVDQTASSVKNLTSAQEGLAAASSKTEKATLSVDAALARVERRYDQEANAAKQLARVQQDLNAAREAGRISQQRQNELMSLAIKAHNSAGAAAKEQSKALEELSGVAQGLSGHLGEVGGILARIGPAGLAIAATIGGAVLVFGLASKAALQLADDMGKLADTAETVGISFEAVRGLQLKAGDVGIDPAQLTAGLTKFASVLGQVRDGNEGAVKSFDRLQGGLAGNVRAAKTTEEALNLVFEALRKADSASAALGGRELFGKSGAGIARLANASGTIEDLVKDMNKLDVVTGTQAKTWDDLGDRINKNMDLAGTNVKASFAEPVLNALNEVAKVVVEVSRAIRQVAEDLGFNIDTSSIENFRVELQVLNLEIEKFGTIKAVSDLSDRLFGPNFTAVAAGVINTIKLVSSVLIDLINIIASAVAGLASLATLDFSGVARQVESARSSFASLGNTIAATQENMRKANDETQKLSEVSIDGLNKQTTEGARSWIVFGNQVEKIGEITPPVTNSINNLGKANDLAAGKTKKLKEETEKVNPILKELGQVAGQLGGALVSAFLNGKSAGEALNTTLKSISSSAASSAINKLVTGDFSGAAISGAISLGSAIGSFLFGDDEDEKAQQEEAKKAAEAAAAAAAALAQAREAFAGMTKQVQEFTTAAKGIQIGDLTKALGDLEDKAVSLMDAASKAQDAAALQSIGDTAVAGISRLLRQFLNDVPDLISEFGTSGIMQDARQSVRDLMLQFTSLQDSIDEFARRTGADTEIFREQLQTSTFKALVEMLGDVPEISDTSKEIERLKGVASELDDALVQLGISADDAATIVEQRLTVSLQKLGTGLFDPIIREINSFVGGDWINQATDLLARVRQLTSDATELGLDTSVIQTFFILSARNIINENQLVGGSFNALVNMLGLAGAGLKEFNAALESTARTVAEVTKAIQTNEDRLFNAIHRSDSLADQLARFDLAAKREREAEIAAGGEALESLEAAQLRERLNLIEDFNASELEKTKSANDAAAAEADRARQAQIDAEQKAADERLRILQEAQEFLEGATRRIQEWIDHFLASAQSPLSPSQQLASAQQSFAAQYAAAISGNRDALNGITGNAQDVVDAARRYYGSSSAGQGIIQTLLTQLRTLPSQLSPEQFIVDNLTPPLDDINTSVTDTTTAIDTQTDTLAGLLHNLAVAGGTGDPQAIAVALLPLFSMLDTTMDQALNFAEFQAGLGNSIAPGILQQIFNTLDLNGDQLITQAELIKFAAQGTTAALDPIDDNTAAAKELLQQQIQSIRDLNAESVLWLTQIWDKLTVLIQQVINSNSYLQTMAAWAPGSSHAAGGWITGGIPGRDSVSARLMPGEFVVREGVARNNPWLEDFNRSGMYPAANDNGMVAAIHGLERNLMRGIAALIETQLETAGVIARPIEEGNKLQRSRRGEKKKVA